MITIMAVMRMVKMVVVMMTNTESPLHAQASQSKKTLSALMFQRSDFPQ